MQHEHVLAGRSAIVTGGGRGIGAAIAHALSRAGARVLLASRTLTEVEEVAALINRTGGSASAVVCDVGSEASVLDMCAVASDRVGDVDILINNAGIAHSALLHKTTLDDWNRLLTVNATGAFLCTRSLLPSMAARNWGRVVNVASVAGLGGGRYIAAYAASKHAMVGLTRAVAAEVAGSGVTCNAVCPVFVDTPMTSHTIENVAARTGRPAAESLDMVLSISGQTRLVTPAEVAHAVMFLCHPDASAVNGDTVVVSGGAANA